MKEIEVVRTIQTTTIYKVADEEQELAEYIEKRVTSGEDMKNLLQYLKDNHALDDAICLQDKVFVREIPAEA